LSFQLLLSLTPCFTLSDNYDYHFYKEKKEIAFFIFFIFKRLKKGQNGIKIKEKNQKDIVNQRDEIKRIGWRV